MNVGNSEGEFENFVTPGPPNKIFLLFPKNTDDYKHLQIFNFGPHYS